MVWKRGNIRAIDWATNIKLLALAIFVMATAATSWSQTTPATPIAVTPPADTKEMPSADAIAPSTLTKNDYTVSPEDLLEVQVLDVPEVSREYRVSSNGYLTLPLLAQPILAAGQTLDHLQQLVASQYREAGMLKDAVVMISLKETRFHAVLVSGEVAHPESVPIYGSTHLLDVLIQAGGLVPDAGDIAVIMRGEIGARMDAERLQNGAMDVPTVGQPFEVNIRNLMLTGQDSSNLTLYPGDRVTVQRAQMIYIMGAVSRPGGYVVGEGHSNVTVLKALAMAGDVTSLAKKQHITLLRRNPGGPEDKRTEIPVDYKDMVKGKIADMAMTPDDILYVPESGALKAWHATVTSATQVATSGATALMIYR